MRVVILGAIAFQLRRIAVQRLLDSLNLHFKGRDAVLVRQDGGDEDEEGASNDGGDDLLRGAVSWERHGPTQMPLNLFLVMTWKRT